MARERASARETAAQADLLTLVVRDGQRRRVAASDLVKGDLVCLEPGYTVPADLHIIEAHELLVRPARAPAPPPSPSDAGAAPTPRPYFGLTLLPASAPLPGRRGGGPDARGDSGPGHGHDSGLGRGARGGPGPRRHRQRAGHLHRQGLVRGQAPGARRSDLRHRRRGRGQRDQAAPRTALPRPPGRLHHLHQCRWVAGAWSRRSGVRKSSPPLPPLLLLKRGSHSSFPPGPRCSRVHWHHAHCGAAAPLLGRHHHALHRHCLRPQWCLLPGPQGTGPAVTFSPAVGAGSG